jgi:hypothetical protein
MTGLTQRSLRNRFTRITLQSLAPAVLAIVMVGSASAQDAEPPSLVGRISGISGQASIQRSDAQDWADAGINDPVTIGDAVYAPEGSDVRLQIGATDLDLKSNSEIDIALLDQNAGTIRLDSGSLDVRVSAVPTADGLSIATPRGTVRLTERGTYHIDAGTEDTPTQVTAWNGSARLGDSATAVTVQQGQTLVVAGTADAPQYSYSSDIGEIPREWRTPPRVVSTSEHYVAAEMTGSEDLYQYGAFESAPQYGTVWYPREVPTDWQPYRYGHWEHVAPWGQTWVDDQPWGFAPFHYGRWAHIGNRWGWVPGQYAPHPVYAPALVAFVGGGGFSASISFGGGDAVGWVPLAPGEGYRPPYRASPTYIQNINRTVIVNNTVTNNTVNNNTVNNFGGGPGQGGPRGFAANAQPQTMAGFANQRFATVVPASVVSSARPVAAAAVQVHPEAMARAPVNAEAIKAIKPLPVADRPRAQPGPVARPQIAANPRAAANVRPALPPAGSRPQGGPNHPNAQPVAPATPAAAAAAAARPGQPPAPVAQRPGVNQPAAAIPPGNRPAIVPPQGPGAKLPPAPIPPRGNAPAVALPNAPANHPVATPQVAKPEAPKPEVKAPQNVRPVVPPAVNKPVAATQPHPQPPQPQAQPPHPAAAPPKPQAQPPHPAAAPPKPQAQPPHPAAAPPKPQAQPPHPAAAPPKPQAQPPHPAAPPPKPQAQPPHPAAPPPKPQAQPPHPAAPPPKPQAQPPHPAAPPANSPHKKPGDPETK